MTRPGHVELFDREFDPAEDGLPVDIATLVQLRERAGDERLQRPGRVFFHVAIVCTAGEGLHEVDFTPVTVESVGRELSFNEASNFAKFFHRMTGENPEAWRRRHTTG